MMLALPAPQIFAQEGPKPEGLGPSAYPGPIEPKDKYFPPEIGDSSKPESKVHRGSTQPGGGVRGDPKKPVSTGVSGSDEHAREGGTVVAVTQTLTQYLIGTEPHTGANVWFYFRRTEKDSSHAYCWIQLVKFEVTCNVSGGNQITADGGESHDWCIDGDMTLRGATDWGKKGDDLGVCYSHAFVDEETGSVNLCDRPELPPEVLDHYASFLGSVVTKVTLTWSFEDYLWCTTHKYILDSYEWKLTVSLSLDENGDLQVTTTVEGPRRRDKQHSPSENFAKTIGGTGPQAQKPQSAAFCVKLREGKNYKDTSFPGVAKPK